MRQRVRDQPVRTTVLAVAILAILAVGAILQPAGGSTPATVLDTARMAEQMSGDPAELVAARLPDRYHAMSPEVAADLVADDAELAISLTTDPPREDSAELIESTLARLGHDDVDAVSVNDVFTRLPQESIGWLAVLFPSAMGNLTGAPFEARISANAIRLAATVADSRSWPSPPRPWTGEERDTRADFQRVIDGGHQLIYFDPLANDGQGSWAELRGDLSSASQVGVLVPGGSAFISSDNFTRYSGRAESFVSASDEELAMIVWAGSPFPSGWIQEASPTWSQEAAVELVAFMADLHHQMAADVSISLAGHSYGGAVVGLAETHDLRADRVLHLASAGAGYGVSSPYDYTRPCRERYDLMAPGDPISYVQNVPGITGLGHGIEVSRMPGVQRLVTGSLPDDPEALDDVNRTLGSMGIAGKEIGGVHAHSEIFIPHSDAWQSMFSVFTMGDPRLLSEQPEPLSSCG